MESPRYEVAQDEVKVLWQDALADYESDTKRTLPPATLESLRSIATPEDLATQIEAAGVAFSNFRSKNRLLWSTLKTFIAPVSTLATIAISPASVADYGIVSAAVLGAIVHLVKSGEGVSNAYDWIDQIFQELLEFAERLAIYAKTQIDLPLQRKIAAIFAFILRIIGRSERLIHERRFREYMRVTFLGKDAETQKLLEDLNKLFGGEQRFVLAITYQSTQRIEENFKGLKKSLDRTSERVDQVLEVVKDKSSQAEDESRLQQILCSTPANDKVEEIFTRTSRSLLKGTGVWLQQEQFFSSWMAHEATILWIFGGPGAGKTFLSTWIVKQLQTRARINMMVLWRTSSLRKTMRFYATPTSF